MLQRVQGRAGGPGLWLKKEVRLGGCPSASTLCVSASSLGGTRLNAPKITSVTLGSPKNQIADDPLLQLVKSASLPNLNKGNCYQIQLMDMNTLLSNIVNDYAFTHMLLICWMVISSEFILLEYTHSKIYSRYFNYIRDSV